MSKQKREVKISFLTTKIVSLLCLTVGVFGFLISVFKLIKNTYNIIDLILCGISFLTILLPLCLLIAFFIVYFQHKSEVKYREYLKLTLNSKTSNTFSLIGMFCIYTISTIVLIILTLII